MSDAKLTPERVRNNFQIHQQEDGGIIHTYQDEAGKVSSVVYHLYPGITLIRKDVNRPQFISNWRYKPERGLIIEHCWEGRLEFQVDRDCLYHAPGDVIILRTDYSSWNQQYPLNHFRSLAISINLDEVSSELGIYLERSGFSIDSIMQKFQLDKHFFCVLKENEQLENIFKEIYSAPKQVKINYWKIKVFELLLLLASYVPKNDEHPKRHISRAQSSVVKAARQYLIDHPYERITIETLASKFSISPSHLKAGFRTVYGTSIKRFDREQKMQLAARLLRDTNQPVGDIARQFGYVNTSKFSDAFRSIMGKNPNDYRSDAEQ